MEGIEWITLELVKLERDFPNGGYSATPYYLDSQCLSLEHVVSATTGEWLLVIVRLFWTYCLLCYLFLIQLAGIMQQCIYFFFGDKLLKIKIYIMKVCVSYKANKIGSFKSL